MDDPDAALDPFRSGSQVGVVGTLHHVSAIRDSDARRTVIGLTYRLGRHIPGVHGWCNLALSLGSDCHSRCISMFPPS